MDDLITWLRTQLDDDERVAKRASSQHTWWVLAPGDREIRSGEGIVATTTHPEDARQVARWNPARVLAEVEARRRVLDEILRYEAKIDGEWGCCHNAEAIGAGRCPETRPDEIHGLRLLAQPYAGRLGWREEWAT